MSFFLLDTVCPSVFIHIPKTGGLSIRGQDGRWAGAFKSIDRTDKREILETTYKDVLKFAFVRNPWDRAISAYFYTKQMREKLSARTKPASKISLKQFLDVVRNESIRFDFEGMGTPEGWIRHHAIPMTHPYNGLDLADHVGRFENLQADFNIICRLLGEEPRQLPRNNTTTHDHYSTYYDTETFEIVADYFSEDIKRFGYTFEKGEEK